MATIKPGDKDPRHGTLNGYTNLGCNCAKCKAANTANQNRYMRSNPEQREKHRDRSRARYNRLKQKDDE